MKKGKLLFFLLFLPLTVALVFTTVTCLLRLAYFSLPASLAELWSVSDALTDYFLDAVQYLGFGIASVLILFGTGKDRALVYPLVLGLPILLPVLQFALRFLLLFGKIPSSQFEDLFYSDFLTVLSKVGCSILFGLCSLALFLHAVRTKAAPRLTLAPKAHIMLIPFTYCAAMTVITLISCVTGSTELLSSVYALISFAVGYFLAYLGAGIAFPSASQAVS